MPSWSVGRRKRRILSRTTTLSGIRRSTDGLSTFAISPHANQNMNDALERNHGTFKSEMKKDKVNVQGRTIEWLLAATLRLENFYWCTSEMRWQGRIQNHKIEEQVWNTIHRARTIPDANVILMEHDG